MSFKPIDVKRDEFRKYLERTGVLDAISKVFVKLLQQQDKPENALEFLYANLGVNKEQTDSYHRLKLELEDAHNEIANLKRTIEILEGEKSSKKSPPATAIMEATDKDNDSKSSENNQDDEMKDESKTAENDIAVIESASATNEDSSTKGNDENEKNIESSSADEQQQQKESSKLEKN